jgi:hypothetical protein
MYGFTDAISDPNSPQAIRDLGEFGREFLETLTHNVLNPETPRYHWRVAAVHVKDQEVPRLVRDAGSQARVWALALQDAIFFISERPSNVQAVAGPRPTRPSSVKGRKSKHGESGRLRQATTD